MPLKKKTRSAEMQVGQCLHGGTGLDDTPCIVVRRSRLELRFRFHPAELPEFPDGSHGLGVLSRSSHCDRPPRPSGRAGPPKERDLRHRRRGRDREEALLLLPRRVSAGPTSGPDGPGTVSSAGQAGASTRSGASSSSSRSALCPKARPCSSPSTTPSAGRRGGISGERGCPMARTF